MKIFLEYNNILCDNCMKMNFNMIVQFYKLNLFKRICNTKLIIKLKLKTMMENNIMNITLYFY